MMNATFWTGLTLIILGAGSLAVAASLHGIATAVFGLALIGLGVLMRQPGQVQLATGMALVVVLLGLLDALNSIGHLLSERGLTLSHPIGTNLAQAVICSLYLSLWGWEHRGQRQNGDSQ